MKHLTLLLLFTLLFACFEKAPTDTDPLAAARDKLLKASSVSFEMDNIWNNTFSNDTTLDKHQAVYLRREGEAFPFDFAYLQENYAAVYDNGILTKVNVQDEQIITFTDEEALAQINYEGAYATDGSPIGILQDTAWVLSGRDGNMVTYEYIERQDTTEDGRAFILERIHIDEERNELTLRERFYTLNEEPVQHIVHAFNNYRFNDDKSLNFSLPEGFTTIAYADLEKMEKNARLAVGDKFADFTLTDIDGNLYDTKALEGKKAVYTFSFIGCGGCEYARKELEKMDFTFNDKYVGLYLSPTNTEEQLLKYRAKKPWPFPLAAVDNEFTADYGVYVYPTFITVDEHGMVEEVISGYEEDYFLSKAKTD